MAEFSRSRKEKAPAQGESSPWISKTFLFLKIVFTGENKTKIDFLRTLSNKK